MRHRLPDALTHVRRFGAGPWLAVGLLTLAVAITGAAIAVNAADAEGPSGQAGETNSTANRGEVIDAGRTLEAFPGHPKIHVQLRRDGKIVEGEAQGISSLQGLQGIQGLDGLDQIGGGGAQARATSFQAFLDTGASAYVLSKSTAERFDIEVEKDALYHEVGLHGEIPMNVSKPYTLALADSSGKLMDQPGKFNIVDKAARLQMNRKAPAVQGMELITGPINIIGMPAISQHVVEIDPTPIGGADAAEALRGIENLNDLQNADFLDDLGSVGAGPAVTLHEGDYEPDDADLVVDLHYKNYSRRNYEKDRGALPTLAENPTIRGIRTAHDGESFTGVWLLDTGAPASLISTEHAIALGLYNERGQPNQAANFTLTMGGVSGQFNQVPGYRIDEMRVPTADGGTIRYKDVSVLVTDVSITIDGEKITLDGIFGTNLLLPSVGGLGGGLPSDMAPGPFKRVWIDGPKGRLLLQLRDEQE